MIVSIKSKEGWMSYTPIAPAIMWSVDDAFSLFLHARRFIELYS